MPPQIMMIDDESMGRRNHASKMLANNTYSSSSESSMESNEGNRRRSRRKRDQQTATIAPFATIASRRGSTGTIGVRIWERFSWNKTKRRSSNDRTEDDDVGGAADASPYPQSERNATTNGDNSP